MSEPSGATDDQYFAAHPGVASSPQTVVLSLPDARFELLTDRGVFSHERIDSGTRLLLLDAPPPPQGDVQLVDVGCGYGPIALTLARRSPAATVWAVDVNERALACCAANARQAGFGDRIRTCTPDQVPTDLRVDGIWSNPPIRIGKAALHALLTAWLGRLVPDAHAVLVVQKHLGADSLARWLDEQGFHTTRLVSRSSYRLLDVTAAAPDDTVHKTDGEQR